MLTEKHIAALVKWRIQCQVAWAEARFHEVVTALGQANLDKTRAAISVYMSGGVP